MSGNQGNCPFCGGTGQQTIPTFTLKVLEGIGAGTCSPSYHEPACGHHPAGAGTCLSYWNPDPSYHDPSCTWTGKQTGAV